ncbi:nuclear transport factor 2 family protein [Sphingomonas sp. SUN019]|uniref:limonene-1,2-epoxide hydrolase family protein n=1 Tax=Sphingomonas sp. SUN019 TaxID=2937788 RepID=UPI0021647C83|nr:limonene-1,2-epoxide hydrolase family protein [Sphingomonas sp. SUN019]UVO51036.1 nuclear transport factor 2 family protein [Sphingomonas sp. SUN019]
MIDPARIVENLVAAFNRRDRAAVYAALHDDILCVGIPLPPAHGKAAATVLLDPFFDAEEIDWRIVAIAASGPIVLTERIDRFRFAGRDWTEVRAAGVFHIANDGRIIAWRDYFDMAELVAALPPSAAG